MNYKWISLTSNWRRFVVFFICISTLRKCLLSPRHFSFSLPFALAISLSIYSNLITAKIYSLWLPQIYFTRTKFVANKLTTSIRTIVRFVVYSSAFVVLRFSLCCFFSFYRHTKGKKIMFFSIRFILNLWTNALNQNGTFELDYGVLLYLCVRTH